MITHKSVTHTYTIEDANPDSPGPISLSLTRGADTGVRIIITQGGTIRAGYAPRTPEDLDAPNWFVSMNRRNLVELLDPFKNFFSQLVESVTSRHLFQRIEAMQAEGSIEEPRALELTSLAGTAAAYCQNIMQLHVGHDALMTELFGHNWTTTESVHLTGGSRQYLELERLVDLSHQALSDDLNQ